MQVTEARIPLRPRSTNEAIDLGLRLAQTHWLPLWRAWCVQSLPLLLLAVWLTHHTPWLAVLVVWWCKPFFETTQLHILSRVIFGETPTLREALRAWRGLHPLELLMMLTLRRFSLRRSFALPVHQLEGLRGAARRQRLRVLLRNAGAPLSNLTVTGSIMESGLLVALVLLAFMLMPTEEWHTLGDWLFDDEAHFVLVQAVGGWLVMSVVGPFYAAAGFGVYLNQRAWLEGWDIELAFRQLQARRATAPLALVLLAACLCLGSPPPAVAAPPAADSAPLTEDAQFDAMAEAASRIDTILADPVFHNRTTTWWPKGFKLPQDDDHSKGKPGFWQDLLAGLGLTLARGLQVLLWVIAAGLALYLVWRFRDVLPYLGQLEWPWQRTMRLPPVQLFDLDIRPESLPDDVAGTALALWQQQRPREALSLLYRAALSRLVHEHHLDLRQSATEGEALRLVQASQQPALTGYFATLTGHWQQLAYAHQLPAAEAVPALCQQWPAVFGPAVGPAR